MPQLPTISGKTFLKFLLTIGFVVVRIPFYLVPISQSSPPDLIFDFRARFGI